MGVINWVDRAAEKKAAHDRKRKDRPAVKIPTDRIDLGTLGYEGYWVEMPRSVKEGFLHEFSKVRTDGEADSEQARETNIKILELITAWNIDDDEGKVFPVLSKAKTKAEKERIVSELPVDVIVHIAQRIAGNVQVPERTKDF